MAMNLRNFTRNFFKPSRPIRSHLTNVDYAVCIDLECTCDSPAQIYPMEVIEIACVKVDVSESHRNLLKKQHNSNTTFIKDDKKIFHKFAKPIINPELTLFCQELTGIQQADLEDAPTIDSITKNLLEWMKDENLIDDKYERRENFLFASCGNFDLTILAPIMKKEQFSGNDPELPFYFKEWINVKKTFVNHRREWPRSLYHMMELLNLDPYGRLHSARDDCINLARVIESLHRDSCKFHTTNRLIEN